jgi:hypothetical protein
MPSVTPTGAMDDDLARVAVDGQGHEDADLGGGAVLVESVALFRPTPHDVTAPPPGALRE